MSQPEPKTCLDCCNFVGYCKLADYPPVVAYCRDATNFVDADMSRCPCFVEDL
ncbi:hypothetical protein [Phormidium sp. FACHB-1136]|uniref:hypothetical protein n=1 Tax=Phormidium sp. FACHB-1136 TaxID=2692848 RepID=UPI001682809F|nr:hypothetical protein [Phormidium sp. FACHB-1136]MBD2428422.1 hypothetical protein [Phormidium sp. FACHB-1136]